MFGASALIKHLEDEKDSLKAEVARLSALNSQLVEKVMALSNERAFALTNGDDDDGDFTEIAYDELGRETPK